MKKFLLAILAVGAVATAQAQKAGSILLYGSAGYMSDKTTDDDGLPGTSDEINKTNAWNFSPGIGYQFNKNWTAGINFSYRGSKTTDDNGVFTEEEKFNELRVGPFVRYTMPINRIFFIFNQVNVSYLSGKHTMDDGISGTPDVEHKFNGFSANWFPAVGVSFTRCMAFTLDFGGLSYDKRNWDMTGPQEINNSKFDFTFGRAINIGIQANFGGHSGRKHRGGGMEPGMERRRMDTSDDDSEEDTPKRKSSDIEE